MSTTTDTPPSSTRPPQCRGPDQLAPRGWTWAVRYRRSRRQRWVTLFTAPSAAAAWSLMCSQPFSGHYHPLLVRVEQVSRRTDPLDAGGPARHGDVAQERH